MCRRQIHRLFACDCSDPNQRTFAQRHDSYDPGFNCHIPMTASPPCTRSARRRRFAHRLTWSTSPKGGIDFVKRVRYALARTRTPTSEQSAGKTAFAVHATSRTHYAGITVSGVHAASRTRYAGADASAVHAASRIRAASRTRHAGSDSSTRHPAHDPHTQATCHDL